MLVVVLGCEQKKAPDYYKGYSAVVVAESLRKIPVKAQVKPIVLPTEILPPTPTPTKPTKPTKPAVTDCSNGSCGIPQTQTPTYRFRRGRR